MFLCGAGYRGLDSAGKTTLVKHLKGEPTDTISPTLGFNIETLSYGEYQLNLWDVGGQTTIRSYWRNYFEATDGLVWVVDATDLVRLDTCRAELAKLLVEERLFGASLLVLANKQDLPGALSDAAIAEALDLGSIKNRHWSVQSTSAVTGAGLEAALAWLVEDIASRIYMFD